MDIETPKYNLFVDNSGSVSGCHSYWQTIKLIIQLYGKDIQNYYFWNSNCNLSSKKLFEESIASQRGTGGTNPQSAARQIVAKKYTHIILVTDGQVGDVQDCDRTFQQAKQNGFNIQKAICYVIVRYSDPNLSVTCPFTRYSESQVFSKKGDEELKTVINFTAEDYKQLDGLVEMSLANFQQKYPVLQQLIIAKNMGKNGDEALKNQLVILKNKLVKQLSRKMGQEGDFSNKIRKQLKLQNLEGAMQLIKNMNTLYFQQSLTGQLQKKFNYLISLCGDLRGQYDLGQIKSNKMATAVTVKEGQLDQNVELAQLSSNPIQCPIIMDEAVPQILIDQGPAFLLGIEKCIVDDITACPLRILNYPALCQKLKGRLSNYTGTKYCDKLLKNPFTQNRLIGSIPLGTHKSHIKVANSTIAKLFSEGKVMGNLNLYFAVIWILIDEIEYLRPIKVNATEHLMHRLHNTKTMASLCGLSQYMTTQISTDVAIWYCLNSCTLNTPVQKDTFRFHLYDVPHLKKIVQLLGYPIHPSVDKHYLNIRSMYALMDKYKKMNKKDRDSFKFLSKALYQKAIILNLKNVNQKVKQTQDLTEIVLIDGPASQNQIKAVKNLLPVSCKQLPSEDITYIFSLLDDQKTAEEIFIDFNHVSADCGVAQVNWAYQQTENIPTVSISPETLRPYKQDWKIKAEQSFNMKKQKLYSLNKQFEKLLLKYKTIPTKDELLLFCFNRQKVKGVNTLPTQIEIWIQKLLTQFKQAIGQRTVEEAVKILKKQVKNDFSSQINI